MATPRCNMPPGLLKCGDVLFSSAIILPLNIAYWSTTWSFLDTHVLPGHPTSAGLTLLLSSYFMICCGYHVVPVMRKCAVSDNELVFTNHVVISTLFNYLSILAYLFLWKGGWMLTEQICGVGLPASLILFCVNIVILVLLRSSQRLLTSPYSLSLDYQTSFYIRKPLFKTEPDHLILHSLDVFFSVIVLEPFYVMLWVGFWNASTAITAGYSPRLMCLTCIAVGFGAYFLLAALQRPLHLLAQHVYRTHRYLELAFSDVLRVVSVVSMLVLWRGCWGYTKDFILTDELVRERPWVLLAGHCGSFVLLGTLQASGTLSAVGCVWDSEGGSEDAGITVNVNYLQQLYAMYSTPQVQHVQAVNVRETSRLFLTTDEEEEARIQEMDDQLLIP